MVLLAASGSLSSSDTTQQHAHPSSQCYRVFPECTKSPHSIPFRLDLGVADRELS
jgi:hypothetical protein